MYDPYPYQFRSWHGLWGWGIFFQKAQRITRCRLSYSESPCHSGRSRPFRNLTWKIYEKLQILGQFLIKLMKICAIWSVLKNSLIFREILSKNSPCTLGGFPLLRPPYQSMISSNFLNLVHSTFTIPLPVSKIFKIYEKLWNEELVSINFIWFLCVPNRIHTTSITLHISINGEFCGRSFRRFLGADTLPFPCCRWVHEVYPAGRCMLESLVQGANRWAAGRVAWGRFCCSWAW